MLRLKHGGPADSFRADLYRIIFGTDTSAGRIFDVILIVVIILSVIAVMLDSMVEIRTEYGVELQALEWLFTVIFTVEYGLRIWCVRLPRVYIFSFFGVIDFLAIIPTYLSVLIPGGQFLSVVRILRVLRIFRVLKLVRYIGEARLLRVALRQSRYKISVFLLTVLTLVVQIGALMYLIEGASGNFSSIPKSIYWAVVTLTTVGYGDVVPQTPLGQTLASIVMILGYAIIAIPTGILGAELVRGPVTDTEVRHCPNCKNIERDSSSNFCRLCGEKLK
tara:strand:+ start:1384 stop:2214 length:831 start_codon:yes stop_codon:yes gene_type:complete